MTQESSCLVLLRPPAAHQLLFDADDEAEDEDAPAGLEDELEDEVCSAHRLLIDSSPAVQCAV